MWLEWGNMKIEKELDLNFENYRWREAPKSKKSPEYAKEEFMKIIEKEKDMKAEEMTEILNKHLKKRGFLTIQERNYVGYNKAPFDLTAGDENNLKIYGFEIKSDRDTFERLENQLGEYSFVCEEIYLVLHKKKAPKWLPSWCGVLRISKKGIYKENHAFQRDPFEISTGYEWDSLAIANGLGKIKNRLGEIFKQLIGIRKNILFNRYFATTYSSETQDNKYEKFYPLSDDQKRLIVGFDVPYHLKNFNRDLNRFEKRLEIIKQAVKLGGVQKKL